MTHVNISALYAGSECRLGEVIRFNFLTASLSWRITCHLHVCLFWYSDNS